MKRKFVTLVALTVLMNVPGRLMAEVAFQSSETKTSLLELYTSEGCSSCPPAETWISQLKKDSGLWKTFVPLAFHVDYWDYLGWRDPWSAKQFTSRQRAYASSWKSGTIYTPGFILNGTEWRNWSGRKLPSSTTEKAGILKIASIDKARWQVRFDPGADGSKKFEVHAALLASDLNSNVKAGENRGRRLEHDFVVLKLVDQPLPRRDGAYRAEFTLDAKEGEGRLAVAAWVTREGSLEPVQATGGWLK